MPPAILRVVLTDMPKIVSFNYLFSHKTFLFGCNMIGKSNCSCLVLSFFQLNLFIYLGFYVAFNTVQVISRRVVGRAEETSTYSLSGICTVNCRPMASNYQLSHLRP